MICFGFTAFIFLFAVSACNGGPLPPIDLRCNNLASTHDGPVLGVAVPTFSWLPRHTDRVGGQTAFQVLIYSSRERDTFRRPIIDSGKVISSNFRGVEVNSSYEYQSSVLYSWTVRWWDENDVASDYSPLSNMEAGILNQTLWKSSPWIAAPDSVSGAPYLRSPEFSATSNSTLRRARVYVSGLGYFRLYLNGKRIGDEALAPGWTKYSTRVFYVVYDVMQYLEAKNVLGAIVGIGRRNTTAFRPLDNVSSSDTVPRIFRLKLVLTYYDSDVESYNEIMVSSTDWRAASSPVVSSSIYNGEVYDARLEKAGWNEVGYKLDDSWKQVTIVSGPQGIMSLQLIPPIKQDPPNPPIDIQTLPGNIYVLDFGTNLAGYCRLTVKGDKGQVIVLKHAEVKLHPPYGPRNGSLYYANLRSAEATDTYILRGDPQGETYEPFFTYHGFRYVEVRGYPGKLEAGNLQQIPIHADVDAVKTLNTSSLIMNDLQSVVKNSHLSNFLSIVTGCAQRDERIGWMGDAGLSSDIMALGFDMHAFFVNMLRNIRDDEGEDGSVPDVVPYYRYGHRPADPSWSAAFPQVAFVLYKYYGDLRVVRDNYDALKRYFKNIASQIPSSGLAHMAGRYGDWCILKPPNPVPTSFTSAFSYIENLEQFVEMARAIGESADAVTYADMVVQLKEDYFKAFWNGTHYCTPQITSYALPLFLGVTPSNLQENVEVDFLNLIDSSDGCSCPSAGIIGSKFLPLSLSRLGRTDVALQVAEQLQVPSWGHMLYNTEEPATALWELWNGDIEGSGMNSRNHHMFSSIGMWIRMQLGGLQPTSSSNSVFQIFVARTTGLSYVDSAEHRTTSGRVAYDWRRSGGTHCRTVPENRSPASPILPLHADLQLDCGSEAGGVIQSIDFADFGLPTGGCGSYGYRSSCSSQNASEIIKKRCLGQNICTVPSGVDFWDNPCNGSVKQLTVQYTCSKPDSIVASIETSVGMTSELYLPLYGLQDVSVQENQTVIWSVKSSQNISALTAGISNIDYLLREDTLKVTFLSGLYTFSLSGTAPERQCYSVAGGENETISCPEGTVFTRILFASFGTPKGSCGAWTRGECHAGSSKMQVERYCLGEGSCYITAAKAMFGTFQCSSDSILLAVEAFCGKR